MTTSEVASRLVELCRRADYHAAQKELYSADAVSIEPEGSPNQVTRGEAELLKKSEMFNQMFDVHGGTMSDPIVSGNYFSCRMTVDVTDRKSKARFNLDELAVYKVKDSKIVSEQFFFSPPGA